MGATTMVENHVHHHLHSFLVGLVNQLAIFIIRSETRLYPIKISNGISVIRTS